jgi:hypothetical protein|uniref:Uncharacterized protein n=1 Tax=Eutreptiella gymnastica TaxID=73025 RepID=A0A7S4FRM4_9EUGL
MGLCYAVRWDAIAFKAQPNPHTQGKCSVPFSVSHPNSYTTDGAPLHQQKELLDCVVHLWYSTHGAPGGHWCIIHMDAAHVTSSPQISVRATKRTQRGNRGTEDTVE